MSAVKGCSLPKTTLTSRCLHGCFPRSHALWFSVNHGQHEHVHQDWSSPVLAVFMLPMETQNSLLQHPESYLSFFHCLLPSSPCWFSSFLKQSPLLLSWLVFHYSLSSILWSSPLHSHPSISFRSNIYLNLDSTDEVKKQKQKQNHTKNLSFSDLFFLAKYVWVHQFFCKCHVFPFLYIRTVCLYTTFYHCIHWWASRLVPQLGCCKQCNIKRRYAKYLCVMVRAL